MTECMKLSNERCMNDMTEWMTEWMHDISKWMNAWMHECMQPWMAEWLDEWMNDWLDECVNGMNGGLNACMTEWIHEWNDMTWNKTKYMHGMNDVHDLMEHECVDGMTWNLMQWRVMHEMTEMIDWTQWQWMNYMKLLNEWTNVWHATRRMPCMNVRTSECMKLYMNLFILIIKLILMEQWWIVQLT